MKRYPLIIITPVYEDLEASSKLFKELSKTFDKKIFIVAVDDGSIKQPLDTSIIENADLNGVVIKLKRNVGHQRAISIGLGYVAERINEAQIVVTMDSDGEDTPASIKELLVFLDNNTDVVVAQRKSRVETLKFKIFYAIYKFVFHLLSGKKISFGNFMAFRCDAVRVLVAMSELGVHVAGTVLSSKLRIKTLPLDRGPRYVGQSKMNFVGLVLHGFKSLMIFAEDVLVRVGIASAFVACLALMGGLAAILLKVFGYATPGWFSIVLGILLLVFLQTGTITLMVLLLTGVVKSNSIHPIYYQIFVDKVINI